MLPPALAVSGTRQQPVDDAFVGRAGLILEEGVDLLGSRRQTRQVEPLRRLIHSAGPDGGANGQPRSSSFARIKASIGLANEADVRSFGRAGFLIG